MVGSFVNGIQVSVGSTSSPATVIWQNGDDLNSNTKIASSGLLPIPSGTYYRVEPFSTYAAFETITITWYPIR